MKSKNPISIVGTILLLFISYLSHAQLPGTFSSLRSISNDQTEYGQAGFFANVFDQTNSSLFTVNESSFLKTGNAAVDYTAVIHAITFFVPTISSSNPTTCNGTDGSVTINGLIPGTSYDITYTDDGNSVGPVTIVANGSGQAIITGLNAGVYAGFILTENGNTTNLFSGVILTNPVIVPAFSAVAPFCSGTTAPILATTSNNGITGTWNPATVSNTASGSYTFTPAAGQCAIPVTINITVTPRTTPTFSFATSFCEGETVPALPATSDNGVAGSWSPSSISSTASGSYTFTPNSGLCANPVTINVTITPNVTPAFSFATTICENATAPILPATSNNGVTGTWSPAAVSNTASGSYTFTPTAGQCALPVTINVTVTPNVTPTFSFATTICENATAPTLPGTSDNGVTGTWSPATVSNTASGSYTFTPTAGLCALPVTINVTITPNVTPTFSFATTICENATAPILPATSNNGVTGTWSPAAVSNTASGSYTFTPTAGQCALPVTINVTVTPNVTPTFSFATTICENATAPTLPGTSDNGVTGTWSPATVSNTASGSYTFTPTAGLCALPVTINVTVTPNVTPAFSFATTICANATAPTLPGTSDNGVTGTWSPSTVSNTASGSYTFTPTAGLCALPVTINVTVTTNITPTFSIASSICNGATAPTLPTTSDNGITGTWSPATVSNTASGSYTFTPTAGLCALPVTINVAVNPIITPTFSFATSICNGATAPSLPGTSDNGITGTWSPATIDNTTNGSYTFTPTAGQCAAPVTVNVTVNPILTPTFSFATTICANATAPTLPATSNNGIAGTWSPATVSNTASGTYTFTPNAGQCGSVTSINVTVTPNVTPTFSFGTTLSICSGDAVPALPATSDNGIAGTWSPATVSNIATGTYTFTPTAGVCATTQTFVVTVNPILTPNFSFGTSASICIGAAVPTLPATSTNGITGTWSPATVDNQANGTYTFTPSAGQCATTQTYTVQVNQVPSVNTPQNITVNDGTVIPVNTIITVPATGVTVNWTNSNPAIGLAASGTGNIPSFTAVNPGNTDITATITITPRINGCIGTPVTYTITVKALNKDVFVPNVFSPNNDGKNDVLLVYGNYINRVEMRIFNQWGQQVAFINDRSRGWDGTHKGKPQPVGVYVYALRAVLTDGRTVDLKGSITLVR